MLKRRESKTLGYSIVMSGKRNVITTNRVILTSGKDIHIAREECSSCKEIFLVVRTPPYVRVELPCPNCEQDKMNELVQKMSREDEKLVCGQFYYNTRDEHVMCILPSGHLPDEGEHKESEPVLSAKVT